MPIAEKFSALGVGNGFTHCLPKLNVQTYDYWTTLSGVNKNNPTTSDSLIAESLDSAMKLFWNFNGFTGDCSDEVFDKTDITIDNDQEIGSWRFRQLDGVYIDTYLAPEDRVCYKAFIRANKTYYTNGTDYGEVYALIRPTRMYNGSTDDEGNFVGYGLGLFSSLETRLRSYIDDTTLTLHSIAVSSNLNEYVEFYGMHFVLTGSNDFWAPNVSYTQNDTSITVTAVNENSDITQEVVLRDLEFYTYATP